MSRILTDSGVEMADLGDTLILVLGLVFVVGSMLAMGFSLTVGMIVKPLKNWKFDALMLLVNYVVVPVVIIALGTIISLPEDVMIGMIIMAFAAGAPFIPKLVHFAKGDIALAVGTMTLLMVMAVIVLPIMLPLVLPDVQVDAWEIAKPLIFLMLVPLGIGLLVKSRYEHFAEHAAKLLVSVTTLSVILLLFLFFAVYWSDIVSAFGTGAIAFSIFFVLFALAIGYFAGGRDKSSRQVLGISTSQRNISAGILIAEINFVDRPMVGITILILSLASLILLMVVSGEWGRKKKSG
jgi:predicted Na+-dependent transporter